MSAAPTLREAARAKVNLCLHVVGKRADGYHLLDSLAVFPQTGDWLEVGESDGLSLELTGRFGANLRAEPDNLVVRAARGLAELAAVPARARLVLEKNLPVSSGIGGGSADAAAALRVLARLWGVQLDAGELAALALRLGADVPVCLAQRPTRMQGIGEILAPAPRLPECGMVLINPLVAVATPAVFKARRGGYSPAPILPDSWADAATMAADLAGLTNDLQAPAIALCPQIAEVLAALQADSSCLLARMSGSGATCFGLYATADIAAAAAARMARSAWWVWGGALSAD
ncbi:MAG: 4-(cytidine 5'-diphospho)-2-C-methyl-D-erythritol kinase [Acetobacteraceae bacterium]|nr:4-(cytidine 5'-diphospho)-2-C-methyl-D-erythritol kinase [Acetobacteraceae bacterium]